MKALRIHTGGNCWLTVIAEGQVLTVISDEMVFQYEDQLQFHEMSNAEIEVWLDANMDDENLLVKQVDIEESDA